jgi:hypothetical protein
MQISLQKIRAARLRGDFSYEQPYHQAEYTPYPQSEIPDEETTIYLSELIEKYCIKKIKTVHGSSAPFPTTRTELRAC